MKMGFFFVRVGKSKHQYTAGFPLIDVGQLEARNSCGARPEAMIVGFYISYFDIHPPMMENCIFIFQSAMSAFRAQVPQINVTFVEQWQPVDYGFWFMSFAFE